MKSLIVLGILYAIVAVLFVVELINHGFSSYAWRFIFVLVIGAVFFLAMFIESCRAAKNIIDKSGYDELKQDMENLLRDMKEEIYGDEDEGKEPIMLYSPVIGVFTYRRKPEWYEGYGKWCGEKIHIMLHKSMNEDPSDALSVLERYFKDCKKVDRILRGRIAEKKDKKLAKRIFATNITLTSEGTLELDYADPGLEYYILGIYNGKDMKVKIRR